MTSALFATDDSFARMWQNDRGVINRPAAADELELRDISLQALADCDFADFADELTRTDLFAVVVIVCAAAFRSRHRGRAGIPILSAIASHLDHQEVTA